jgi:hypothetical protein
MSTSSYPVRTEQNVIGSDGTLIISHGELTGGSAYNVMKTARPENIDLPKTFKDAVDRLFGELSLKTNLPLLTGVLETAEREP